MGQNLQDMCSASLCAWSAMKRPDGHQSHVADVAEAAVLLFWYLPAGHMEQFVV